MYKFIYKDKKTGKKIYSNEEKKDKNLELLRQVRGGLINNIMQK